MIEMAAVDMAAQADPDSDGADAVAERYRRAQIRAFDGDRERLTEMDALVAYLQMLGTLVDFDLYRADQNLR
jgi:cytochrome c oxidase cbb3-type subunit 2